MLKYLRMGNKRTKAIWLFLIVATIAGFLLGFVAIAAFMEGGPQTANDVGMVDGKRITRIEYMNQVAELRDGFTRQTGNEPDTEEQRQIEMQAWRNVVTQRLVGGMARDLGLEATDREVVLSLQTSPPAAIASAPAFQTDGKFDPNKYVAAMRDPNNNWGPFEDQVRQQLPLRKLQERISASLKLSEPELRQAYRDRFEQVALTVLQVAPSQQPNVAAPADADVDRMYAKYRSRFASGPRTQLEVLQLPFKYSPEEARAAREQALSLAERARRGEDFAQLAKDYSEGPGASRGGELQRVFQPAEFGPAMEQEMLRLEKGGVSAPFQDGPYFVILKVLDRLPDPMSAVPSLRVAQIAIRIRAGDESRREQYQAAKKIRDRGARVGLGKAAAENGLATSRTAYYDYSGPPPQLALAPAAAEWGLGAKEGGVSPVFEGIADFTIVQVADQSQAGAPPKDEIAEQLRQLAQVETRVQIMKPAVERAAQRIAGGASFEQAAKEAGGQSFTVPAMTRYQPDPRLGNFPEVIGATFAAAPGRVVGPLETLGGWFLVRVDKVTPANPAGYEQARAQIAQEMMTRRQQRFFLGWLAELRAKTRVQDFRLEAGL